jgi:predicted MFS family arabinose efflux permease
LFAGRRAVLAIVVATVLVAVALGTLAFCAATGHLAPLAAIPLIALWGIGTGGVVVSLQARVLAAQPEKPDVASALNSSAFNLGIGGGAIVGGFVLRFGGLDAIPAVAALLIVPAIALQVVPFVLTRRA